MVTAKGATGDDRRSDDAGGSAGAAGDRGCAVSGPLGDLLALAAALGAPAIDVAFSRCRGSGDLGGWRTATLAGVGSGHGHDDAAALAMLLVVVRRAAKRAVTRMHLDAVAKRAEATRLRTQIATIERERAELDATATHLDADADALAARLAALGIGGAR